MAAETQSILSLRNIKKSFSNQEVISDLSLSFTVGDIAMILGANGAGKSTLMKIIVGLFKPDKGDVKFKDSSKDFFSKFATYLGHENMLYEELTVRENIDLMLNLRKIKESSTDFLKEWQIEEYADKRISELSRGMRYRTGLCNSFLHQPKYLFLDEPSSALDQGSLEILSSKIKHAVNKREGFAVIITHDVERLSHISNRFIVLDHGKLVYDSASSNEDLNTAKNKSINFYHKANR